MQLPNANPNTLDDSLHQHSLLSTFSNLSYDIPKPLRDFFSVMALDSATFQIPVRGSFSDSERDGDLDNEPLLQSPTPREKGRFLRSISLLYCLTILSTIIFLYLTFIGAPWDSAAFLIPGQSDYCKNPTLRREWRTLSIPERLDYLTAVQCLGRQPSRLNLNHSLYDDFPWVHSHMGNFCKLEFQPISCSMGLKYRADLEEQLITLLLLSHGIDIF